jgi:hypothetical protein
LPIVIGGIADDTERATEEGVANRSAESFETEYVYADPKIFKKGVNLLPVVAFNPVRVDPVVTIAGVPCRIPPGLTYSPAGRLVSA